MTRKLLSMVMIVKNEAERIAGFLEHHQELCDEFIVLDTGSTDDTIALAKKAGARVFHFEWCDDFSAARNASLEHAGGRWALCLDADERIARSDFPRLKAALQGPDKVFLLPQRNYYDKPEHAEWQPTTGDYPEEEHDQTGFFLAMNSKLFPIKDSLRWTGRVHEDISPAAAKLGVPISTLEVPIHHYGYVLSDDHNQKRNRFYGELVRLKAEDNPDDVNTAFELACILIQEGKALEAIPVLERLDEGGAAGETVARARTMLAKLRTEQGKNQDALEILERAIAAKPDWLFSRLDLIRLLALAEQWPTLEKHLNSAKSRFGDHPLLLKEECRFLIVTGRLEQALPVTRRVAVLFPDQPEYAAIADKAEALLKKMRATQQEKTQ